MQNNSSKFKSDIKQRCYDFSLQLISFIDTLPKKKSAFIIADQLLRSGTSIGANLIEARAASSKLEFKKFYEISLKSANETKYWLGLLQDSQLAKEEAVTSLLKEATELANMLAAGVMKLKGKTNF
jgi:four helix bundle protein